MWFAKWFGGRDTQRDDDEPARFPVVHTARPTSDTTSTAQTRTKTVVSAQPGKPKGFDPYNSGSFDRRVRWERTNRR